MNLEINLTKLGSIYSQSSQILARRRSKVDDSGTAMNEIVDFISKNMDTINMAVTDKELIGNLEVLKSLSIDEFQSLRYRLAEAGLGLLAWKVSDMEVNSQGIPAGSLEYNIVDFNDCDLFIPQCTKITGSKEAIFASAIYKRISDIYGIFEGPIFEGSANPITQDTRVMKEMEDLNLPVSPALISHVNSILDFMNRKIFIITD